MPWQRTFRIFREEFLHESLRDPEIGRRQPIQRRRKMQELTQGGGPEYAESPGVRNVTTDRRALAGIDRL